MKLKTGHSSWGSENDIPKLFCPSGNVRDRVWFAPAEMSAFKFIQCKIEAKPDISTWASEFLPDKSAGAKGFLDVILRAPAEMSSKSAIERK